MIARRWRGGEYVDYVGRTGLAGYRGTPGDQVTHHEVAQRLG